MTNAERMGEKPPSEGKSARQLNAHMYNEKCMLAQRMPRDVTTEREPVVTYTPTLKELDALIKLTTRVAKLETYLACMVAPARSMQMQSQVSTQATTCMPTMCVGSQHTSPLAQN